MAYGKILQVNRLIAMEMEMLLCKHVLSNVCERYREPIEISTIVINKMLLILAVIIQSE